MSLESLTAGMYPPPARPITSRRRLTAGIPRVKVLHLLCNALNLAGQKAYLVLSEKPPPGVHPFIRGS